MPDNTIQFKSHSITDIKSLDIKIQIEELKLKHFPDLMVKMVSLAQLLILFDHALLAVLFLIALFCIVSVVLSSIWTSKHVILHRNRKYSACPDNDYCQDLEIVERTDTCYSVKNGTSVLYESDLNNVV